MNVILEVVDGPLSGHRKVICPPSELTIGRTEKADFALSGDGRMSSVHLRFKCSHESCCVRDLNSTNGTLVNGQPINEYTLADGDRITAGQTTFRVHIVGVTKSIPSDTDNNAGTSEETANSETSSGSPAPRPFSQKDIIETVVYEEVWIGAILEINSGNLRGKKIWVRKTQWVRIGSAETADQAINDPQLSATHFSVEYGQTGWQIRDLNSTNGTYINGQRVSLAALNDGDRILAGATTFVARLGNDDSQGIASSTLPFGTALVDEDPQLRREALYAAVWTRQPWLLDYCREQAAEPSPENIEELQLLAVLGTSSDLQSFRRIGETAELGEIRYGILASYGHPNLMDDILNGIDSKDPVTAESAAAAFTRITGVEVEYVEGKNETLIPDKQKAQGHWETVKDKYSRGTRWCCGRDLSKGAIDASVSELDMLTHWELRLRGKYNGTWQGNLADLKRFPISD